MLENNARKLILNFTSVFLRYFESVTAACTYKKSFRPFEEKLSKLIYNASNL